MPYSQHPVPGPNSPTSQAHRRARPPPQYLNPEVAVAPATSCSPQEGGGGPWVGEDPAAWSSCRPVGPLDGCPPAPPPVAPLLCMRRSPAGAGAGDEPPGTGAAIDSRKKQLGRGHWLRGCDHRNSWGREERGDRSAAPAPPHGLSLSSCLEVPPVLVEEVKTRRLARLSALRGARIPGAHRLALGSGESAG